MFSALSFGNRDDLAHLSFIFFIVLFGVGAGVMVVAWLLRFIGFLLGHLGWLLLVFLLLCLVLRAFRGKGRSSPSSPLSSDEPPPAPSHTGARVPDIFLYGKLKSERKDEPDPPAHRHMGPCSSPHRYEPTQFSLSNFRKNRFGASSGRAPSASGTTSSYWSPAPVTAARPSLFQPKFGLHPKADHYEPARSGLSNFGNDQFGIGLGRAPSPSGTSSSWGSRGRVTASRPSLFQPKIFGEPKRQQGYPYFDMPRPSSPIFAPKSRPSGTVPTYTPPSPAATQPRPFFEMQQPPPAPAAPASQHPVGLGDHFGPSLHSLPLDDLASTPRRNSALWAPRSSVTVGDSTEDVSMRSALRPSSYMHHPRVSAGEIIRLRIDLNDLSISMPTFQDEEMRGPGMGDMDVDCRALIEQDVAMAPPVVIEEDVRMSTPRLW
ncbi:hypothetical protein FS749_008918 [Ceratobasidium sp. UAMH 11750]|nr:hypothetical protein FS749_008918 [Ceratobasidium sp. UAMH 11750]